MFGRTSAFVTTGVLLLALAILLFASSSSSSVSANPNLVAAGQGDQTGFAPVEKFLSQFRSIGAFARVRIGVPTIVQDKLKTALQSLKLEPNLSRFDVNSANYAVDAAGNVVELEIPLSYSGNAELSKSDTSIMVNNSVTPIKIVGAVYNQVYSAASPLLVVLIKNQMNDFTDSTIGFYDEGGQRLDFKSLPADVQPPSIELRQFIGVPLGKGDTVNNYGFTDGQPDVNIEGNGDGPSKSMPTMTPNAANSAQNSSQDSSQDGKRVPVTGDRGGLISARETCFTVGLYQVCYNFSIHDGNATDRVNKAIDELSHTFAFKENEFDNTDGSVGDIVGDKQRRDCQNAIEALNLAHTATPVSTPGQPIKSLQLLACAPNVYYAAPVVKDINDIPHAEEKGPFPTALADNVLLPGMKDFPIIGVIHVEKDFDVDTFGNSEGELFMKNGTRRKSPTLPAGEYLILSMLPKAAFGDLQPLAFVNMKQDAYVLPGLHVQAFGNPVNSKSAFPFYQAYINDPASCQAMMP